MPLSFRTSPWSPPLLFWAACEEAGQLSAKLWTTRGRSLENRFGKSRRFASALRRAGAKKLTSYNDRREAQ
jgi:hypothetical protein